jgi:hypothetical protein
MGGSTGLHFAFLVKHELPRHCVVIDHGHSRLSKVTVVPSPISLHLRWLQP